MMTQPAQDHDAGNEDAGDELDVAIVGMAGRFPGAPDCDAFWEALRAGRCGITRFTRDALIAAGVPAALADDPSYVPVRGVLDEADAFDAAFFGVSPREAEVLDPQQRVLLECAWHALEDAGCDPHQYPGAIGVFAGVGLNTYLLKNVVPNQDRIGSMDEFQIMILNDKDTLPTRIAYKLDLRGPAVNVQTSCSTGLVAVHLACNSLLLRESDLALAGAAAIKFPQVAGHVFRQDGIMSRDGLCRAFDAGATGTVGGSGAGMVALKRLADAIADGDAIRAVIRGSAINNDGSRKVSYTAPSVAGQAEVIESAQARGRAAPESIGYVEAHGTATPVGDPIEVEALTRAFGGPAVAPWCALGTVKANIGHLDTAAGIAGLVKATLALEHREIPPTPHFEAPNPRLDLGRTPFRVSAEPAAWPSSGGPRRAGVSSFGVGGTNAHVVLQEAPERPASAPPSRPVQLLTFSARSPEALDALTERALARIAPERDPAFLADAAFTLHVGRTALPYRRALVRRDPAGPGPGTAIPAAAPFAGERPLVFLFPGQGSQRPGMGAALYDGEPTFRSWIDRGASALAPALGLDLRDLLLAAPADRAAEATLSRTAITQPVLFLYEYALAAVWAEWGLRPKAVLGHSVGAYAAACVAGVLSFEDALALVAERGRLMQALPPGAMLAMECDAGRAASLLPDGCGIAAVNAPRECVASGPAAALEALARVLDGEGIRHAPLRTSHAFHSPMMEPAVAPFRRALAGVALSAPRLPFASDSTGAWLGEGEATSPVYWADHIRAPVRFADAMATVREGCEGALWLEVGPGSALTALARRTAAGGDEVFVSANDPAGRAEESERMVEALGRVWVSGGAVDWRGFHAHERRARVRLPGYPFERRRYFIDARPPEPSARPGPSTSVGADVDAWFHRPVWTERPARAAQAIPRHALVLADEGGIGERAAALLAERGVAVSIARRGGPEGLDPADPAGFARLIAGLEAQGPVDALVYCWPLDARAGPLDASAFEAAQGIALHPLPLLIESVARAGWTSPLRLFVATRHAHAVTGDEAVAPALAPVAAAAGVVAQEYANIGRVVVDLGGGPVAQAAERLAGEILSEPAEALVAFREGRRWGRAFVPAPSTETAAGRGPAPGGAYLLLGGLGRVSLAIAALLAEAGADAVVLADIRDEADAPPGVLAGLRARGVRVETRRADIADPEALRALVDSAIAAHGALRAIVHGAGCAEEIASLAETTPEVCARHFAAKVHGTLALERALEGQPPTRVLLISSLASVLGGLGHTAYAAANAFLDAFAAARRQDRHAWTSAALETWNLEPGTGPSPGEAGAARLALAMDRDETARVLARLLAGEPNPPQLVVARGDLAARLARWVAPAPPAPPAGTRTYARPPLSVPYRAPGGEDEHIVAGIWGEMLGIAEIGVDDNFFELGGDSLLATQIVARLRDRFRIELPLRVLFETPSVAGVCAAIAQAREERARAAARDEEIELLLAEIEAMGPQGAAQDAAERP